MQIRERLTAGVVKLFSHGPQPLANTSAFHGDPGLFGPGSMSWTGLGDVSSFIGGVRALLMQSAHPEVVAGVAQHSAYREDPLGRLNRTSFFVTSTNFGAMPEVHEAIGKVKIAHQKVSGFSERGKSYSAANPEDGAWVQNTLTDSFLVAYQTFAKPLTTEEADQFVFEQSKIGELLGVTPLPKTANELRAWVDEHPRLATSEDLTESIKFLKTPPLPFPQLFGYKIVQRAAVSTISPRLRNILDLQSRAGSIQAGRALTNTLRWAMKSSPSWRSALLRCDAQFDPAMFRSDL
jgi:uncharacterized protein (DUF2236 family)